MTGENCQKYQMETATAQTQMATWSGTELSFLESCGFTSTMKNKHRAANCQLSTASAWSAANDIVAELSNSEKNQGESVVN